jgi:hypothetical protein
MVFMLVIMKILSLFSFVYNFRYHPLLQSGCICNVNKIDIKYIQLINQYK